MDIYEPIYQRLPTDFELGDFIYYEVRVWRKHQITVVRDYKTLKEAKKYYKEAHWPEAEDKGWCYVEIIKVENIK